MSQENVEIVRRAIEALNRRDLTQIFDLFDSGVEVDLSRNFNPEVYHGHAGLELWRSAIDDVWEDFHGAIEELIDAGDNLVVAGVTMRGKGKESGVAVESRVFSIWTVREAKVAHVVGGYRDRSEALEAAGLPT